MSAVLQFSTDDISPRHRLAVWCETVFVANLEGTYRRRIPRDTPALVLLKRYLALLDDVPAALADPGLQHSAVTHVYDLLAKTLGATRDAAAIEWPWGPGGTHEDDQGRHRA